MGHATARVNVKRKLGDGLMHSTAPPQENREGAGGEKKEKQI